MRVKVACIVPTLNGGADLKRLLDSLAIQTIDFDLFVVDSGSEDQTAILARANAKQFFPIKKSEFDHGGTRQMMVDANPDYEFYVFMTQDAYLADPGSLARLVAPLMTDARIAAVCGRQLPHKNATLSASHARLYNYPAEPVVRSFEDIGRIGIKAAFLSNSFSAYRASALENVGGFPEGTIFGEDLLVATKILLAGWQIAYAADAECFHSHNLTLVEEFRRHFDIGVMFSRERWILKIFPNVSGEGYRFVISEIRFYGVSKILLWPKIILRNFLKYLAFKLGTWERKVPYILKYRLTANRGFWQRTV